MHWACEILGKKPWSIKNWWLAMLNKWLMMVGEWCMMVRDTWPWLDYGWQVWCWLRKPRFKHGCSCLIVIVCDWHVRCLAIFASGQGGLTALVMVVASSGKFLFLGNSSANHWFTSVNHIYYCFSSRKPRWFTNILPSSSIINHKPYYHWPS